MCEGAQWWGRGREWGEWVGGGRLNYLSYKIIVVRKSLPETFCKRRIIRARGDMQARCHHSREVWRDSHFYPSRMRSLCFTFWHSKMSFQSSGRPTPQITCSLPPFRTALHQKSVSPPLKTHFLYFLLVYRIFFPTGKQPLGKDAERGTALRHWDAVSRQSGSAVHPTTR